MIAGKVSKKMAMTIYSVVFLLIILFLIAGIEIIRFSV